MPGKLTGYHFRKTDEHLHHAFQHELAAQKACAAGRMEQAFEEHIASRIHLGNAVEHLPEPPLASQFDDRIEDVATLEAEVRQAFKCARDYRGLGGDAGEHRASLKSRGFEARVAKGVAEQHGCDDAFAKISWFAQLVGMRQADVDSLVFMGEDVAEERKLLQEYKDTLAAACRGFVRDCIRAPSSTSGSSGQAARNKERLEVIARYASSWADWIIGWNLVNRATIILLFSITSAEKEMLDAFLRTNPPRNHTPFVTRPHEIGLEELSSYAFVRFLVDVRGDSAAIRFAHRIVVEAMKLT